MIKLVTYDNPIPTHPTQTARAVFLAGPTARDGARTPWRQTAITALEHFAPDSSDASVVIPEFSEIGVTGAAFAAKWDDLSPSTIDGLRRSTQRVLDWETAWIERCRVLMFWCDFSDATPGKTTRCEVSRAIAQKQLWRDAGVTLATQELLIGVPRGADTTGHIKYHADRANIKIYSDLIELCAAASAALHGRVR